MVSKLKRLKIEILLRDTVHKDSEIFLRTIKGIEIGRGKWWFKNKQLHISNLLINERYREKGYGNLLARIIIDIAKFLDADVITLTDGSIVEGFWQKLGFMPNCKFKRYMGDCLLEVKKKL